MYMEVVLICAGAICVSVDDGKLAVGKVGKAIERKHFLHQTEPECLKGLILTAQVSRLYLRVPFSEVSVNTLECMEIDAAKEYEG